MESLSEFQSAVLDYCKTQVNEVTFECWFRDVKLVSFDSNRAVLSVTNGFKKDIVENNYIQFFKDAFLQLLSFDVEISIVTEDKAVVQAERTKKSDGPDYEYTFDTFIVGNSNRYAHAISLAVAENPAEKYNPLFIYGKSGLGKTHLLKAISAQIAKKYPDKKIVQVSCETFTNEFIYMVHNESIDEFREKYRKCDVLLIDDIQLIAGKEETQIEFFNTFEALYNSKKQMVITSDRPPKDIKTLTDRMRSRFEQGVLTDIQPPEFETRVAIIRRKAELLDVDLSDDIVFYIADQVKSNIRQLEGIVKRLQAMTMMQEKINYTSVQSAIKDIRSDSTPEPITVQRIIDEVGKTYDIQPDFILGDKHDADITQARHVAIYVVHEITKMSTKKIGKEFNREHSSIIYSIKKVKSMMDKDEKQRNIISDLISNLQNE